jgi:tripartite-type tricarboxylate transporter receptor subunit TctC
MAPGMGFCLDAGKGVRPSRRSALLFLAAASSGLGSRAMAETKWPVPITRFISPFAAGGALDVQARIVAELLKSELGTTLLVETHPGAGGAIGTRLVVQAAPDGSAFLFTSSSVSILPALNSHLGFDPVRDLRPISVVCDVPPLLLVRPDSRFKDLRQLIGEGRASPERLNYGSGGIGSSNHLAAASFARMAKIEMVHIPYGGTAQTLNALYAGQVDLIFAPSIDVLAHVREGQLRVLGVGMPERVSALPQVPAIAEVVPGYAVPNWFAIFAPARLPDHLRTRMVQALATIRDAPLLRARFEAGAAVPRLDGPDLLAKRMAEEKPRWAELVTQLGIQPQ